MFSHAPSVIALFDVGGGELVLIGVVALLLFGGDLPKVMRQVGRVVGDLRKQAESLTNEFRDEPRRSNYTPPRLPRPANPPQSLPVDAPDAEPTAPAEPPPATPDAAGQNEPPASSSDGDAPPGPGLVDRKEPSEPSPGPG